MSRLLIVLALMLVAPALAAPAGAEAFTPIQPGASLDDICTVGFVFDGTGALEGRVFVSTAAHCVRTVGKLVSSHENTHFGRVVLVADDVVPCGPHLNLFCRNDFALIEVDPAFYGRVQAEVRGHPGMPTGVTRPAETVRGDHILLSGYGVTYSLTQQTREWRKGILIDDSEHEYGAVAPAAKGDSGGPVLHESGKALGMVNRQTDGKCDGCVAAPLVGMTIEAFLRECGRSGWTLELRTAA